ncbi:MAG: hypothetical protein ACK5UL_02025 [bacterium]
MAIASWGSGNPRNSLKELLAGVTGGTEKGNMDRKIINFLFKSDRNRDRIAPTRKSAVSSQCRIFSECHH